MSTVAPPPLASTRSSYRTTLLSQAVRVLCKAASVLTLARLVAPADHGLFAMAASVFYLLALFRDAGLGQAAVQAPTLDRVQMNTLFVVHLALGAVLALALLAAAPLAARFYAAPPLVPLMAAMSLAFVVIGAGAFVRPQLARELRFDTINFLETASAVAGTAAMIAAGLAGAGAYSFVVFLLVSELVATILAWRALRWRPDAPPVWPSLRPLLPTGAAILVHQVVTYVLQQLDTIVIGRRFGAFPLGLYNRAGQLLALPYLYVAAPLGQVLLATLSRLPPSTPEFVRHAWETVTVVAHLVLPLFAVCIVLPEETVRLVLGPQWPGAAPLVRVLAIGGAAAAITSLCTAVNIALGRTPRLATSAAVALPLTALAIWFGSAHGVLGVATALTVLNVLLAPLRAWWLLRDLPGGLRGFLHALRGPLVTSVAAAAGLWLGHAAAGNSPLWLARLAAGLAGGAGAVALAALILPFLRREWLMALDYLPRRPSFDRDAS